MKKIGLIILNLTSFLIVSTLALALSSLLIIYSGYNPLEVCQQLWKGAFGTLQQIAGVFNFWIPLALVTVGLIITFRSGLWNIGVEGQMMFGAILASGIAIFFQLPSGLQIAAEIIAGMVGGMFWALVTVLLKSKFGVHELYGGVALNAIANVFTNYLIANVWSSSSGNAQDTGPFHEATRLNIFSDIFPTSINMIIITLIATGISAFVLKYTHWGLMLKAVGQNPRSAAVLGIRVNFTAIMAIVYCGAFAGLAGAYRVLFTYGTLRSFASGGIGYLGVLVALLTNGNVLLGLIIAFFFGALIVGNTHLRVVMGLDVSFTRTLQGILTLLIVLSSGVNAKIANKLLREAKKNE